MFGVNRSITCETGKRTIHCRLSDTHRDEGERCSVSKKKQRHKQTVTAAETNTAASVQSASCRSLTHAGRVEESGDANALLCQGVGPDPH